MSPDAALPVVLALDTSTAVLSAALGRAGEVHTRSVEAGRHTGALVPEVVAEVMAQAACTPTDLTAIAVGVGPAPYTSLRAGIMFAEAAAAALGIPLLGACSLDVTARAHVAESGRMLSSATPGTQVAPDADEFVVAVDARRRELYWARYTRQGQRRAGPQVDARSDLERLWAQSGIEVVTSPPPAAELARWAIEEFRARDGAEPELATTPHEWVAPSDDAAAVRIPQALLVPRPLYLRRPDAVAPVSAPPPASGPAPASAPPGTGVRS